MTTSAQAHCAIEMTKSSSAAVRFGRIYGSPHSFLKGMRNNTGAVQQVLKNKMFDNRGFALPQHNVAYTSWHNLNQRQTPRRLAATGQLNNSMQASLALKAPRTARENIAHEAFHLTPGIGQSETLARFYGGWKAPRGGSLPQRFRSGMHSVGEYWSDPSQYRAPRHLLGNLVHRLMPKAQAAV